jgi:hypothetical protein
MAFDRRKAITCSMALTTIRDTHEPPRQERNQPNAAPDGLVCTHDFGSSMILYRKDVGEDVTRVMRRGFPKCRQFVSIFLQVRLGSSA